MRVLSWLGVCVGLALIVVSAGMNYLFWSAHGTTAEETVLFGCASICLDILKVMLPSFIVLAAREQRLLFVTVASALFFLLSAGSFTASLGFAAVSKDVAAGRSKDRQQQRELIFKELTNLESREQRLAAPRSIAVIEEDLKRSQLDARWDRSQGCRSASRSDTRSYCQLVAALQVERASSIEARAIEQRRAELKSSLAGEGGTQDPALQQSLFLAGLIGVEERSVRSALSLLFAVLIELASGLSLWIATAHYKPLPAVKTEPPPTPLVRRRQRMHALPEAVVPANF